MMSIQINRRQDPRGHRLGRQGHPEDLAPSAASRSTSTTTAHVFISRPRRGRHAAAPSSIVETIVNDPEVGAIYKGKVTRLMNFGAFVEIAPGKEGLVHISKLDIEPRREGRGCRRRRRRGHRQGHRDRPAGPHQPLPPRRAHRHGGQKERRQAAVKDQFHGPAFRRARSFFFLKKEPKKALLRISCRALRSAARGSAP